MGQEGDKIKIGCQTVPPESITINNNQVEAGSNQPTNPRIEQVFGPRLETN